MPTGVATASGKRSRVLQRRTKRVGLRCTGLIFAVSIAATPVSIAEEIRGSSALERWVDDTFKGFRNTFGYAAPPSETANTAAESLLRLPRTGLVSGREVCIRAANGAPDCRSASNLMCRTRGYGGGSSIDITTAERCGVSARVAGRDGGGDCAIETFVTRAVCQ